MDLAESNFDIQIGDPPDFSKERHKVASEVIGCHIELGFDFMEPMVRRLIALNWADNKEAMALRSC